LSKLTKTVVPTPLAALKNADIRFNNVCEKQDMNKVVLDRLGIE